MNEPGDTREARTTEARSNLRDQPSDERRMLPWVLVALVVVAVAAWGVVEWTGWGEPRRDEEWKGEAPPPSGERTREAMPPPPAPALAYQQYHAVCQDDSPADPEQLPAYAATCLGHALETLRAAVGSRAAGRQEPGSVESGPVEPGTPAAAGPGSGGADLADSLARAESAVLRLQRAAATGGGSPVPVELLTVEAAQAVLALARETAAGAESVDEAPVEESAAAAAALDPAVALPQQAGELARFFSSLGEALQPLAQPAPPPAPVPP
ncbi:MAG TPA: hypothetical protein VHQ65_10865 [Thermoanaerobaculia bacterium]|nr:hypothetical protein [Thermoanaerobaculia bacterium]